MKGFTLIEMIATLVLLSIIMIIAIASVTSVIEGSKEKAYNNQIENIRLVAKAWGADNLDIMPKSNESLTIYLYSLKTPSNENIFINPQTDEPFPNNMPILIKSKPTGFEYTIFDNEGDINFEIDILTPKIIMVGSQNESVQLKSQYIEKGLIIINSDGTRSTTYQTEYFENTTPVALITTNALKNYIVKYTVVHGLNTYTFERKVEVVDTTAPVLVFEPTITIRPSEVATFNLLAGITATDNSNQAITITHTGTLSATLGNYVITYRAQDSSGNFSTKTRTITVEKAVIVHYSPTFGVNAPYLSTGMTPIKWTGAAWVRTTTADPNWYDYNTKKWANVITNDCTVYENIETCSMWVWIPRFAYTLTNYHLSTTGTITVKFLKNTTNEAADGSTVDTVPTYTGSTQNNYIKHPAFKFDNKEITGFWAPKFQVTATEGVANSAVGDDVTTKTVKVIPNAVTWRYIKAYNGYLVSLAMKNKATYGWLSTEVDTHLMLNMEWGAIAYLSTSSYGKTTKVWKNPNSSFITGCAGDTEQSNSTAICRTYESANGQLSSTTGNTTGVYDMSAGTWDLTMGNYNNTAAANSGFPALNTIPDKYINRYGAYGNAVYGDAVYEVSSGSSFLSSYTWGSLWSSFPSASLPYFARGGASDLNDTKAGVLAFGWTDGPPSNRTSFRPVIIVGEGF